MVRIYLAYPLTSSIIYILGLSISNNLKYLTTNIYLAGGDKHYYNIHMIEYTDNDTLTLL